MNLTRAQLLIASVLERGQSVALDESMPISREEINAIHTIAEEMIRRGSRMGTKETPGQ